ncbi:MAG: hypothetical protein IJ695_08025 [Butyrivibrio sp.]|nr:hypothetical protein [Butyrivibrio sp.]
MQTPLERYRKINGNTLKVIACVFMFIDHLTAGIILPVTRAGLYKGYITFDNLKLIYQILRGVGRQAFPIFCFLLVEGFIHTKSRLRYALSLLIFGIISEPFFDLTFYGRNESFSLDIISALKANAEYLPKHCNVYFTLFLGLLVMWGLEGAFSLSKKFDIPVFVSAIPAAASVIPGVLVANALHTDYHGWGIALIAVLYILRSIEPANILGGYLSICSYSTEYLSLPGFILLLFYNKKRGRKLGRLKYLFYAFYPVHIMAIYIARCLFFPGPGL